MFYLLLRRCEVANDKTIDVDYTSLWVGYLVLARHMHAWLLLCLPIDNCTYVCTLAATVRAIVLFGRTNLTLTKTHGIPYSNAINQ